MTLTTLIRAILTSNDVSFWNHKRSYYVQGKCPQFHNLSLAIRNHSHKVHNVYSPTTNQPNPKPRLRESLIYFQLMLVKYNLLTLSPHEIACCLLPSLKGGTQNSQSIPWASRSVWVVSSLKSSLSLFISLVTAEARSARCWGLSDMPRNCDSSTSLKTCQSDNMRYCYSIHEDSRNRGCFRCYRYSFHRCYKYVVSSWKLDMNRYWIVVSSLNSLNHEETTQSCQEHMSYISLTPSDLFSQLCICY